MRMAFAKYASLRFFQSANSLSVSSVSLHDENSIATVQAGAGVVLDSVPQSEADETRNKARAVLRAIATAHHAQETF